MTKQREVETVFGKESSTLSINSPSLALAQNEETQNGESDNESFTLIKIHSSFFTDHNHSNGTMRTL